jgi:hypothetical protein
MTDKKSGAKKPKIEKLQLNRLELNKQTVQDLTDLEAEGVKGGMATDTLKPIYCNKSYAGADG